MEPDAKTDAIRALIARWKREGDRIYANELQAALDALLTAQPAEGWQPIATNTQLQKVRDYLCRLAKSVTRAIEPDKPYAFQVVRRSRENGDIEYQIFADTKDGTQIAWVQSTRHDAEFIAACLAQSQIFNELFAPLPDPPKEPRP